MCAKDDLIRRKGPLLTSTQTWEVLFQTYDGRLAGELATAESVTAKDSNYVDTFGSDFAFSFANILSLIAFIISYCLFADELWWNIQQSLPDRATVVLIIILVDKTQLLLILGDVAAWLVYVIIRNLTLLARFIPTTKIRDPLLKTLENAAKSGILLACADGRIRQCYSTICAILQFTQLQQERYLDKGHDDFHYNFNIHVSLATDTLHLLLKGLVIKMLDFMQDMLDDIYPSICDLVTLAQYKSHDEDTLAYIQGALERMNIFKEEFRVYQRTLGEEKNFNYPKALDSICTRANSKAHHITIVKQFYSITNKKETALLAANYATVVKQSRLSTTIDIQDRTYFMRLIPGIQPYLTKLPLSEVAANIVISDFTHAAAVFRRDYVWVQEFKHRDNRRQSRTVTDDGKHIAYIGAFSEVLLFNNNGQIDNTTGMLSVRRQAWNAASKRWTLQAFKFYDLSTIIRLVHLVPRDLPNSITCTTMSYYVNNYIDWDEYNRLYLLTFDIDLLRMLREY
ncbi:hypothetical protein HBI15_039590 [Parastagonospora nodorum]|nr:hypothetical protein HBI15_039590 [Parastagonospora nodorum]